LSDIVPELSILPGFRVSVFLSVLTQTCMVTGRPATQHTSCRRPRPDLAARADRPYGQPTNMQHGTFCYHWLSSG